ncbi:MAG: preprotein translocase subunit SecG [Clostridia bacterium]|nr:preprotein translocase subunit SecG [Clostridia bacterium]
MFNILAISNELYLALSLICIILSVIAAIFVIIVVIMQPGNSDGIGAISGHSETFYGKNKSKTLESKMKRLTVFAVIVLMVCMIGFYIVSLLTVA